MIGTQCVASLFLGMLVGMAFGLMKLPTPAPLTVSGVLGILGLYVGYSLIQGVFK